LVLMPCYSATKCIYICYLSTLAGSSSAIIYLCDEGGLFHPSFPVEELCTTAEQVVVLELPNGFPHPSVTVDSLFQCLTKSPDVQHVFHSHLKGRVQNFEGAAFQDSHELPEEAVKFLSCLNHLDGSEHNARDLTSCSCNGHVLVELVARKFFGIRLFKINRDFVEETQKSMNREVNTKMIKFHNN
jgi:hypothetical protein